uniref:Transcription factor 19 (SC1), like n=1 Tax=Acanthochromis polyacanthus TaxID=80966 RepID=A0A3Q1F989_9TELE
MLSGVQPCFQLLRIGSSSGDSARDLYTFRPALSHSVFRLGRAAELCDVTLDSTSVSRIHAELHAEREAGEGDPALQEEGTWVNEVRLQPGLQWELSDGDTLSFGGQSDSGGPEFYFFFQKVKVRPLDFDAITIPKVKSCSRRQNRLFREHNVYLSPAVNSPQQILFTFFLSINRATVILNSIGSLSKMKGSAWTFKRSQSHEGTVSDPGTSSSPPLAVGFSSLLPPSTSRRKSAHTVLLEDDSSDEPRSRGGNRRGHEEAAAVGSVEPCAAPRCRLPQQDTVQWIQCDVCDAWYHLDCLHVDRKKLVDPNEDFHCGCLCGLQTTL